MKSGLFFCDEVDCARLYKPIVIKDQVLNAPLLHLLHILVSKLGSLPGSRAPWLPPSVHPSVRLSVCPSVRPSLRPSLPPSVSSSLSLRLSLSLSLCLSLSLSLSLSVSLSLSLSLSHTHTTHTCTHAPIPGPSLWAQCWSRVRPRAAAGASMFLLLSCVPVRATSTSEKSRVHSDSQRCSVRTPGPSQRPCSDSTGMRRATRLV